jgi:hypothetical protein
MTSGSSWFWIAPDILVGLFVVGWPWLYRNAIGRGRVLERALTALCITQTKESLAFANYHQDLNLATVGTLLLIFNVFKIAVVTAPVEGAVADWVLLFFLGAGLLIVLLFFLHIQLDVRQYRDIDTKAVSPFYPLVRLTRPDKAWWRVAGRGAWVVFWSRVITAFASAILGIDIGRQTGSIQLPGDWWWLTLIAVLIVVAVAIVVQSLSQKVFHWVL